MRRGVDLPVSVELPGALGQEVARYVEAEAGWQVVAPQGPPEPALTLGSSCRPGRPCVVVLPGTPTPDQVREGLLGGALDVVGWPGGRERLLALPSRLAVRAAGVAAPAVLAVGGTAGGAGTSTVALALGGLCAWSGHRTVVIGGEDLLALCGAARWTGPGAAQLAALGAGGAAAEFAAVARPLPGVPRLWVLAGDGAALPDRSGWPVDLAVVDTRTQLPEVPPASHGRERLVVVTRPDGSATRAAGLARSAVVLVAGRGPLDRTGIRRLLGRSEDAWLPHSARVARAGLLGRVPSSLPGAWLTLLRHTVAAPRSAA